MTDHLPECPMLDERYPKHPLEKCDYCEMLRACEQRVWDEAYAQGFNAGRAHGEKVGRAAGLNAARDAVAAVGIRKDTSHDMRVQALAAIDGLRGKS